MEHFTYHTHHLLLWDEKYQWIVGKSEIFFAQTWGFYHSMIMRTVLVFVEFIQLNGITCNLLYHYSLYFCHQIIMQLRNLLSLREVSAVSFQTQSLIYMNFYFSLFGEEVKNLYIKVPVRGITSKTYLKSHLKSSSQIFSLKAYAKDHVCVLKVCSSLGI